MATKTQTVSIVSTWATCHDHDEGCGDDIKVQKATMRPQSLFLSLPLEIRNIIYELLIQEAVVQTPPPVDPTPSSQTPKFTKAYKLDLSITVSKASFPNLRFPSNLLFTNHQVHDEFSSVIYSRIHHLELTGNFLLGLQSTQSIFDILARRRWIKNGTRSVRIVLELSGVSAVCGGVAVNSQIMGQHPWLEPRLRLTELNVRNVDFEAQRRSWAHGLYLHLFNNLGLGNYSKYSFNSFISRVHLSGESVSSERNTLPDLAKLFETFPLLEKIDMETTHHNFLWLLLASLGTASCLCPLQNRGVEINILLRHWQMQLFSSILERNGIEGRSIQFWDENGREEVLWYQRPVAEQMPTCRIVKYRLSDCFIQPDTQVEGVAVGRL